MFAASIGVPSRCNMSMFGLQRDLLWALWTAEVGSKVGEGIMVCSDTILVLEAFFKTI
jgi:hypothetical protein